MKTKGKEEEKKEEKKRSEEKKVMSGIELRTSDTPNQSFTTRPPTWNTHDGGAKFYY